MNPQDRQRRTHWIWLLLLLALLASCACVYSSTHLALSLSPAEIANAHMLAESTADYGRDPFPTLFAPINEEAIIAATEDGAALLVTPTVDPDEPVALQTPVVIAYVTATSTGLPTAVIQPTTTAPVATAEPTNAEPLSPTATPGKPSTHVPTATLTRTPIRPTLTASPTQSATPKFTATPTQTGTAVPTHQSPPATSTPSRTPSPTTTGPTFTPTPTRTPSRTPSPTPSRTPSATPTRTPSATPTRTPSATPTRTPSVTPSRTPSATPTFTPTSSPTPSPTFTSTPSPTSSPTPTFTPSPTPTFTPTPTPSPTPSPTPIPEILMVLADASNPSGIDIATRDRLAGLGYLLTMMSDETVTAADANGKVLVFVSATTDSQILGATMRDVTTPVMVCESNLYDDMGMTGSTQGVDYGNTGGDQTATEIVDSGHPMAAGFSGTMEIYTSANQLRWGNPNGSAALVATTADGNTDGAIFGYDAGTPMFGLNAPARRVGFFFSSTTGAMLNGNGWVLFDAAVNWAIP